MFILVKKTPYLLSRWGSYYSSGGELFSKTNWTASWILIPKWFRVFFLFLFIISCLLWLSLLKIFLNEREHRYNKHVFTQPRISNCWHFNPPPSFFLKKWNITDRAKGLLTNTCCLSQTSPEHPRSWVLCFSHLCICFYIPAHHS